MIPVTDGISLQDREVEERFVRATGPGGQNVRKEATAVELRFDISASSLPADMKQRLTILGGRHVTSRGVLVVVSRAHRSQAENREAAHTRLITVLRRAAMPVKTRRPTRPRKTVRDERLQAKRFRGATKRARGGLDQD